MNNSTATPLATATIKRVELARALQRLADTAPKRSPKPILTNAKLSINGDFHIDATDCERSQRSIVPCERSGESTALVDFVALRKSVTSTKAKQVYIGVYSDCVRLNGTKLPLADLDEYPEPLPQAKTHGELLVDANEFCASLQSVVLCCDVESSRYALGGVMFDVDGSKLNLVGSDGRRLGHAVIDAAVEQWQGLPNPEPETEDGYPENQIIVPHKAIKAMIRLCQHAKDSIATFRVIDASNVELELPRVGQVRTRLMEGRFPKYRDVIPSSRNKHSAATFDVDEFRSALDSVSVATTKELRGVLVRIVEGSVKLSVHTVGLASESELSATTAVGSLDDNGEPESVLLDCGFLIDYCKGSVKGARATLTIRDDSTAADIRLGDYVDNGYSPNYRHCLVVMPIARQEEAKPRCREWSTDSMRSIWYAYPSSPNAEHYGFERSGCYVVKIAGNAQGYKTGKEALSVFDASNAPIAPFSYFGERDNENHDDTRRRISNG